MSSVPEERWISALDSAEEFGDLNPLAELLMGANQIPQSVKTRLGELMKNGIVILKNPLSNELDEKLMIAAFEYRFRRAGETRDERIRRCAARNEVSEVSLRNLLDGKGRAATRLRSVKKRNPTA